LAKVAISSRDLAASPLTSDARTAETRSLAFRFSRLLLDSDRKELVPPRSGNEKESARRKKTAPRCRAPASLCKRRSSLARACTRKREGQRERERERDAAVDYGYCAVRARRWEKRRQLTSGGGFLNRKTALVRRPTRGEGFPNANYNSSIIKDLKRRLARTRGSLGCSDAATIFHRSFPRGVRTRALIAKARQFVTADPFSGDGTRVAARATSEQIPLGIRAAVDLVPSKLAWLKIYKVLPFPGRTGREQAVKYCSALFRAGDFRLRFFSPKKRRKCTATSDLAFIKRAPFDVDSIAALRVSLIISASFISPDDRERSDFPD